MQVLQGQEDAHVVGTSGSDLGLGCLHRTVGTILARMGQKLCGFVETIDMNTGKNQSFDVPSKLSHVMVCSVDHSKGLPA